MIALTLFTLGLAACGGTDDDDASGGDTSAADTASGGSVTGSDDVDGTTESAAATTGEPIKIGAVLPLSGPVTVTDVAAAAQIVFDQVNADGGIDGRPIEYIPLDDAFNPDEAVRAAQRLVTEDGVVAMAGSASLFDCGLNDQLYLDNGVVVVQAVGAVQPCFASEVFMPLNTGPVTAMVRNLQFATEELGHEQVCVLSFAGPSAAGDEAGVRQWEEQTGRTVTLYTNSLGQQEDPTPFIVQYQEAGCQAVIIPAVPPTGLPFLQAAAAQGWTDVDFVDLGGCYRVEFAEQASALADGRWYSLSEFAPFTGDDSEVVALRETLEAEGQQVTAQSAGGYLAAQIVVEALRSIDGDITADTVSEALRATDGFQSGLVGDPVTWGNNPNTTSKYVQLSGGAWEVATPEWIRGE
jgi:branched-chain amino acid transport system substrate-binding protein